MQPANVTAVVVSFNRRELLKTCLDTLQRQGPCLKSIVVVDNASSDGSAEWLRTLTAQDYPGFSCICLSENTGGAGGFARGLELAFQKGAEWVWMMDDDACPHQGALNELMLHATDPRNIYGSLAVCGNQTSWSLEPLSGGRRIDQAADVPNICEVGSLPFLGFLIHTQLVLRVGLPDSSFFIAADDLEYCLRTRRIGARIFICGTSRIEHPQAPRKAVQLPLRRFNFVQLTPWKRYYDTRNRIFIAREYFGAALYYKTLPSIFIRMAFSLLFEAAKMGQLKAYFGGIIDGLTNVRGRRHTRWGLA